MVKKRRLKLHEFTAENDIRYRGPLSYQGLQILGWLCIVLSIYVVFLVLSIMVNPDLQESNAAPIVILGVCSVMSLPFLLIANFARILNSTEGFKKQLIRNGSAALAIFLVTVIFFDRYVVGLISRFVSDPENVVPVLTEAFRRFQKNGFVCFNLFVDLFLCTLFMFFLTARPQRVFTGNKMYIFRAFAILPIAYEVASITLKGLSAAGEIMLPLWVYPLLTMKPPMSFLVFVIVALYIKWRELRFLRNGKTHEDYQAFLQTNRNSLHFSIFLSVTMVVAAVLDYFIMYYLMSKAAPSVEALENASLEKAIEYATVAQAIGFGNASVPLLVAAPFILLFSYTRLPKNPRISILIPVIGIVLIILMVVEGSYQVLGALSLKTKPIPIREFYDKFIEILKAFAQLSDT